jgi:hypothetical protein
MIATLLKEQILRTANYQDVAGFPGCVEELHTFEELVGWLGNTDFSGTHSASFAAVQDLVRTANTLDRGTALRAFAQWTLQQPVEDVFFRDIVERDVRMIEAELECGRLKDAFEKAYSLAARIAEEVPAYRPAFARWVLAMSASPA